MAVLVDEPMWPAHGRLWAHLVSDSSLEELHAFAARAGLPERGFDLDHYDVPEARIPALVQLGAERVTAHDLTRRLIASGLRVKARDRVHGSGPIRDTPRPGARSDGVSEIRPDP